MKRLFLHTFVCSAAVAVFALATGTSQAQSLGPGEVIVNSRVVSDQMVGSSGGYVGDIAALGSDSMVGDIGIGGGGIQRSYGQPDLFYNFYTNGNVNVANAQMYLSPVPVPPNVGHTFFTYQPFYPHHMLYVHKDRFHNYYDNGRGMNRTRAVYWTPPVRQAASNIYWNYLRLPR